MNVEIVHVGRVHNMVLKKGFINFIPHIDNRHINLSIKFDYHLSLSLTYHKSQISESVYNRLTKTYETVYEGSSLIKKEKIKSENSYSLIHIKLNDDELNLELLENTNFDIILFEIFYFLDLNSKINFYKKLKFLNEIHNCTVLIFDNDFPLLNILFENLNCIDIGATTIHNIDFKFKKKTEIFDLFKTSFSKFGSYESCVYWQYNENHKYTKKMTINDLLSFLNDDFEFVKNEFLFFNSFDLYDIDTKLLILKKIYENNYKIIIHSKDIILMNLINNPVHFLNSKKDFKYINQTINKIYNISNLKQNILDCIKQNFLDFELLEYCKFCFEGLVDECFYYLQLDYDVGIYYDNYKLGKNINYLYQSFLKIRKNENRKY